VRLNFVPVNALGVAVSKVASSGDAGKVAVVLLAPAKTLLTAVVPVGTNVHDPYTSHCPAVKLMLVALVGVPDVNETAVTVDVIISPTLPAAAAVPLVTPVMLGVGIVVPAGIDGAPHAGELDVPVEIIAWPLVEPVGSSNWIGSSVAALAPIDIAAAMSSAKSFFIFRSSVDKHADRPAQVSRP
jgi:hypothetical protein